MYIGVCVYCYTCGRRSCISLFNGLWNIVWVWVRLLLALGMKLYVSSRNSTVISGNENAMSIVFGMWTLWAAVMNLDFVASVRKAYHLLCLHILVTLTLYTNFLSCSTATQNWLVHGQLFLGQENTFPQTPDPKPQTANPQHKTHALGLHAPPS